MPPDAARPQQAATDAEPNAGNASSQTAGAIVRRLGPAGVLAVIAAILPALGGFALLGSLNWVGPWLRSHEELGIALYIGGFVILSGLALLPTYAQAVLGGWAFGFAIGFPAALAGFVGGAALGYVVARWASGDRVVRLLDEHPKWRAVYDALLNSGFLKTLAIVTLVRVPPNSPFAITNLVMAATRVSAGPYLLGTLLGMAPRTAVAVSIAAGLKELDFSRHEDKWLFAGGIVITLVVVAIIGHLANKAVARVTATSSSNAS